MRIRTTKVVRSSSKRSGQQLPVGRSPTRWLPSGNIGQAPFRIPPAHPPLLCGPDGGSEDSNLHRPPKVPCLSASYRPTYTGPHISGKPAMRSLSVLALVRGVAPNPRQSERCTAAFHSRTPLYPVNGRAGISCRTFHTLSAPVVCSVLKADETCCPCGRNGGSV